MSDDDLSKKYPELYKLLEKAKAAKGQGVAATALTNETQKLMSAVLISLNHFKFKFVGDNGFGSDTRPPKIPGYDRIPDFAVDRDSDGNWDMIIEVKSSEDWNKSDDQLKDFWNFSKSNGRDFLVVVPKAVFSDAKKRYFEMDFETYPKYQITYVG